MSQYKKSYPLADSITKYVVEATIHGKPSSFDCDTEDTVREVVSDCKFVHCQTINVYVVRKQLQYQLTRE